MCKVISIVNQKGGCSKTTSAVNIGIGLANAGKKVVLIDADAQGSLTASLGFQKPDGILLAMVDYRTTFARNISAELFAAYGKSVGIFENYIPSSIKAVEASSAGISIYKHDPKGKVAQAYAKVTQEVLNHEN